MNNTETNEKTDDLSELAPTSCSMEFKNRNGNEVRLLDQDIYADSLSESFDPNNSVIDFLHSLEFCPDKIASLDKTKTPHNIDILISHWIKSGRPHPVLILSKGWGFDDDSLLRDLVCFSCFYLSNVKVRYEGNEQSETSNPTNND